MPYAATVSTTVTRGPGGVRQYIVSISETGASATDEWSVSGLPAVGTITHYQATLTAGTAVTIQPKLGKATGWSASTQNAIVAQAAAAAHFNDQTRVRYTLEGTSTIFGISTVNAAADNSISTVFVVVEGHGV